MALLSCEAGQPLELFCLNIWPEIFTWLTYITVDKNLYKFVFNDSYISGNGPSSQPWSLWPWNTIKKFNGHIFPKSTSVIC